MNQPAPKCPKCGSSTVLRTSARGPFYGCSQFPICKSIQPVPVEPVKSKSVKPDLSKLETLTISDDLIRLLESFRDND